MRNWKVCLAEYSATFKQHYQEHVDRSPAGWCMRRSPAWSRRAREWHARIRLRPNAAAFSKSTEKI